MSDIPVLVAELLAFVPIDEPVLNAIDPPPVSGPNRWHLALTLTVVLVGLVLACLGLIYRFDWMARTRSLRIAIRYTGIGALLVLLSLGAIGALQWPSHLWDWGIDLALAAAWAAWFVSQEARPPRRQSASSTRAPIHQFNRDLNNRKGS